MPSSIRNISAAAFLAAVAFFSVIPARPAHAQRMSLAERVDRLEQQQNTAQEASLNASISNEETLIAAQKTTLTAELNIANEELQAIPSQLNQVDEMYSAITGYNTGNH